MQNSGLIANAMSYKHADSIHKEGSMKRNPWGISRAHLFKGSQGLVIKLFVCLWLHRCNGRKDWNSLRRVPCSALHFVSYPHSSLVNTHRFTATASEIEDTTWTSHSNSLKPRVWILGWKQCHPSRNSEMEWRVFWIHPRTECDAHFQWREHTGPEWSCMCL